MRVLLDAWRIAALGQGARLAVAGRGPLEGLVEAAGTGVRSLGYVAESELPALYAAADILVVPSIRTATFTEPWGLVVNEAMLQGTMVIASDAVGAAAGGLLRDGRTGLAFPAGDASGLAARLRTAATEPGLRDSLGTAGAAAARELTPAAWAAAAGQALAARRSGQMNDPARTWRIQLLACGSWFKAFRSCIGSIRTSKAFSA